MPTATAARASSTGTNSPFARGGALTTRQLHRVRGASKTTGQLVSRMMASERMSEIEVVVAEGAPRCRP